MGWSRGARAAGTVAVALALVLAAPKQAAADGAFPDSMQIFVPADHPQRIILATNFGLIISEDDGATWEWACEPRADDNTILYQKAAAPSERIFSVLIAHGLVYSDDLACTWTPSGGTLSSAIARDAFADPTSADRVFAVAAPPADAQIPSSVFRSDDGGTTFGAALFTGPPGGDVLGVESAVSDPATIYVATYGTTNTSPPMLDPMLARSTDNGVSWSSTDVATMLGASAVRIIAVDPTDPRHLFLRITEKTDEKLGVSTDGGLTFTEPVTVADQLTAFVRLASGTILVAGISNGTPVGFRSTDGGATFVSWPHPPHVRALAERAGKLYAAADNFLDLFAAGVSSDEGATFQPLLTYDQVKRVKACVQDVCSDVCDNLAGLTLWPQAVCGDTDGGTTTPATSKSGCGCRAAGADTLADRGWSATMLATVLAGFWVVSTRRRRR